MGRMYICVTPYQLLLTILKIEDSKSELVLQEGITDKEIISNLDKSKYEVIGLEISLRKEYLRK